MTDDQLYRQYLSGDASAGDELMLRNKDQLTAYLAAFLHNAQDAEDLMLDCFTVILVDKPKIAEGRFRAYLFRMARYKANHFWRLMLKRQEFTLNENSPAPAASPETQAQKSERNAVLTRCLNRIATQYREALWLVYALDMRYAQAAEVLGYSVKKIGHLLDNGKKRLRQELEKEGITDADI